MGNAYKMLMKDHTDENQDGAFNVLWKVKAPSKASFFVWRLIRDRLPTKVNLRRRNVEINDPTCPFCTNQEEDAARLFFSCNKILPLWWESLSWTNISRVFPQNPRQHFLQHVLGRDNGIRGQNWQCWWVSLTWSIWQHRNRIVFTDETFNASKLLEDAIFLCWTWLKTLDKGFNTPLHQWSSNMREAFCD